MTTEGQDQTVTQAANTNFNNFTIIQLRLDTDKVLEKIEIFLRGSIFVYEEDEQGNIIQRQKQAGTPKANDEGIQSLMNMVSCVVNPQTVQGNFTVDEYDDYIEEVNISLAKAIVTNCYTWAIKDQDIESITEFIIHLIRPFMSRLIDNEERKGYSNTMRHVESNTMQKSGFKIFGGK